MNDLHNFGGKKIQCTVVQGFGVRQEAMGVHIRPNVALHFLDHFPTLRNHLGDSSRPILRRVVRSRVVVNLQSSRGNLVLGKGEKGFVKRIAFHSPLCRRPDPRKGLPASSSDQPPVGSAIDYGASAGPNVARTRDKAA